MKTHGSQNVIAVPGTMRRYIKYLPSKRSTKFEVGPQKGWTCLVYRDGELLCRDRMDSTEVECQVLVAEAMGHSVRGAERAGIVGFFEIYERP